MTHFRLLLLLVIPFFHACEEKPPEILFQALPSRQTNIEFKNLLRESEQFHVLNYGYFYNGGGVAIGDINNDGLPDIYFTGNLVASHLYLNKGEMEFENIAEKAGVAAAGLWNTGVTMADVNGDGWLDIYVSRSAAADPNRRKNLLFINNKDLTFSEQAEAYGIADPGYSTQAAFFDYDRDGDLDLYVLNHSVQEYAGFSRLTQQGKNKRNPYYGDRLYRNEQIPTSSSTSSTRFTDITQQAGILTNVLGFGLGIGIADINQDRWPDIYISNDYNEQDYLYINQQDGSFSEQLSIYLDHVSLFSMGSDMADINNDGLVDILTLDMLPESHERLKMTAGADNYEKYQRLIDAGFYHQSMRNMLQLNQGNQSFMEVGQLAGISNTDWSWAGLFADFNMDGWKDLFVTNGYESDYTNMDFLAFAANEKIKSAQQQKEAAVADLLANIPSISVPNYIYQNNGDLTFSKQNEAWGIEEVTLSNGAAYGDLDADGDLDLVVNNVNAPATIYQNQVNRKKTFNYITIKLSGKGKNTQAIGAEVCLTLGNQIQCQTLLPTRGFQSAVEPILSFGLGTDSLIDKLEIRWPDGSTEEKTRVSSNQILVITQGQYSQAVNTAIAQSALFRSNHTDTLFVHKENFFVDFDREPLLPFFLSTQGPKIAVSDINKDNRQDFYVGGAKGKAGKLFIQRRDGSFISIHTPAIEADSLSEDIGALFFDADKDGDSDLYVVSGGSDFAEGDLALQDRLYLNNGKGNFRRSIQALPEMLTSNSCVRATDIDLDNDLDLFVGGRLVPGSYPNSPKSYVLINDGEGHFEDQSADWITGSSHLGMVTDARWTSLNGDAFADLVVVGEWMQIRVFLNNGQALEEITQSNGLTGTHGLWSSLQVGDLDQDGDWDLVVGNHGLNSQLKASIAEPVQLFVSDFDDNGTLDPVLTHYINGKSAPLAARDDLLAQLAMLKGKFVNYADYSRASINDIFSPDQLENAMIFKAEQMSSIWIENLGNGQLSSHPLPFEAQVAPVHSILINDFTQDGSADILLGGNLFGTRVQLGRYDANHGVLLAGNNQGTFKFLSAGQTGLDLRGEVRDVQLIKNANGQKVLLVARSNGPLEIIPLNENSNNNL